MLADAVGEPVAFLLQVLDHAGPLAQLDHDRVFDREPAEAMPVGSQGVGEHVGIAAVVLGAGDGESIAEAVELLGVDRIDLETALQQDFDDGTVRHLDRHGDRGRLFAARCHQPVAHLGEACSPVREGSLADNLSIGRDEADLMGLARPVDAAEKSNIGTHDATSEFTRATAMPINPCTGAPGATPHWTCIAANPPGHASPPGTHGTGGKRSLPAGRPVRPVYQSDQIRTREGYRGPVGPP